MRFHRALELIYSMQCLTFQGLGMLHNRILIENRRFGRALLRFVAKWPNLTDHPQCSMSDALQYMSGHDR